MNANLHDCPPRGEECETIAITWRKQTKEGAYRADDTILEAARRAGLQPSFSCLAGNCASCMAKVTSGTAAMKVNHALTPGEVKEGYILTCQAVPTSKHISVVYED